MPEINIIEMEKEKQTIKVNKEKGKEKIQKEVIPKNKKEKKRK